MLPLKYTYTYSKVTEQVCFNGMSLSHRGFQSGSGKLKTTTTTTVLSKKEKYKLF